MDTFKACSFTDLKNDPALLGELKRCASQNENTDAQIFLGRYYESTFSGNDPALAFHWYQCASSQGSSIATGHLANCYNLGIGVPKDPKAASDLYLVAANNGNLSAQYNMANCYEHARGVPLNASQALYWYDRAANAGYSPAQYSLGMAYLDGTIVAQDLSLAVEWLTKAAEQRLNCAYYYVAYCYANGLGVARDYKVAMKWLLKDVNENPECTQAETMELLGDLFLQGLGVTQDPTKAAEWYLKAVKLEYLGTAAMKLGTMYSTGKGVNKDAQKAVECWQKAQRSGIEKASIELASAFHSGKDVPKDLIRAYDAILKLRQPVKGSAMGLLVQIRKDLFEQIQFCHSNVYSHVNGAERLQTMQSTLRDKQIALHLHVLDTDVTSANWRSWNMQHIDEQYGTEKIIAACTLYALEARSFNQALAGIGHLFKARQSINRALLLERCLSLYIYYNYIDSQNDVATFNPTRVLSTFRGEILEYLMALRGEKSCSFDVYIAEELLDLLQTLAVNETDMETVIGIIDCKIALASYGPERKALHAQREDIIRRQNFRRSAPGQVLVCLADDGWFSGFRGFILQLVLIIAVLNVANWLLGRNVVILVIVALAFYKIVKVVAALRARSK